MLGPSEGQKTARKGSKVEEEKKLLLFFFLGHPVCISIPHLLKRPGLDPLRQTTQFCSFNIHLETMCESFLLHNPLSPKSLMLRCKPKDNYIFAAPIPTYLVIFIVYLVTNYKFICHDQGICMKHCQRHYGPRRRLL